jgi:leader peptidase (prepilin peptidase)/N-methyltransferase
MDIPELLAHSPVLFLITAGLFSLMVGSFLNVVIHRLPIMMEQEWRLQCSELQGQTTPAQEATFNLWTPRSRCPACGHAIQATENIPLFSYLVQRGRCAHCQTPISAQYPLVEALSAILAVITAWHFGFGWQTAAAFVLTWALLALSVIDFQHQLLPDNITLPFLWLGLGLALFDVFTDLRSSVIGAMAGYLCLWGVYHLFRLLTGKEGMGYGDFKLLAMLGAWQGWQHLPAIIIVSSAVGAVLGSLLILVSGRDRHVPIPFGPFLAAAGWITLLWGEEINALYLNWMGL